MGADGAISLSTVLGFLLTAVRVAGVFVFVPIPGLKSAVDPARVILIIAITIALFPVWPHPQGNAPAALFAMWTLSEASLGIGIGLTVAFAIEAFTVGAQVIGLQAGYSFASTVDPATQADSTVLVAITQTFAAILFFVTGLDREVLRIFARSLVVFPPGMFVLSRGSAQLILQAGSTMFTTGLRLALPVMAVMVMVDISIALLGRVNAQLHLISVAFPVKMLLGVGLLAWMAVLLPALLRGASSATFAAARALAGH
jgi:flagellar biosynthetic protein FliR